MASEVLKEYKRKKKEALGGYFTWMKWQGHHTVMSLLSTLGLVEKREHVDALEVTFPSKYNEGAFERFVATKAYKTPISLEVLTRNALAELGVDQDQVTYTPCDRLYMKDGSEDSQIWGRQLMVRGVFFHEPCRWGIGNFEEWPWESSKDKKPATVLKGVWTNPGVVAVTRDSGETQYFVTRRADQFIDPELGVVSVEDNIEVIPESEAMKLFPDYEQQRKNLETSAWHELPRIERKDKGASVNLEENLLALGLPERDIPLLRMLKRQAKLAYIGLVTTDSYSEGVLTFPLEVDDQTVTACAKIDAYKHVAKEHHYFSLARQYPTLRPMLVTPHSIIREGGIAALVTFHARENARLPEEMYGGDYQQDLGQWRFLRERALNQVSKMLGVGVEKVLQNPHMTDIFNVVTEVENMTDHIEDLVFQESDWSLVPYKERIGDRLGQGEGTKIVEANLRRYVAMLPSVLKRVRAYAEETPLVLGNPDNNQNNVFDKEGETRTMGDRAFVCPTTYPFVLGSMGFPDVQVQVAAANAIQREVRMYRGLAPRALDEHELVQQTADVAFVFATRLACFGFFQGLPEKKYEQHLAVANALYSLVK